MENYSRESIEEAVDIISSQGENLQQALDIINHWPEVEGCISTALDIIQFSANSNARYFSSLLITKHITDHWNSITDPNLLQSIKDILIDLVFRSEQTDIIQNQIINAISLIAMYEWPEIWSQFTDIILPSDNVSEQEMLISFQIMQTFVEDIESSSAITGNRGQHLKNKIAEMINTIYARILYGLESPHLAHHALFVLNALIMWSPLEKINDNQMIRKLATDFIVNDMTRSAALKCLDSLFLIRTDSSSIFTQCAPIIIHSLATTLFSNSIPITTDPEVIEFMLKFLHFYSSVLEMLFVEQPKPCSIDDIYITNSASELSKSLEILNMSKDEFRNLLVHVYQVAGSIPVESINNTFWQLWSDIFTRITFESFQSQSIPVTRNFFGDLIPNIRIMLFKALIASSNEDEFCSFFTRNCWVGLYRIDSARTIEFLKAQEPSPQLCYAVGCLEFVFDPDNDLLDIPSIICELIEYGNTDDNVEFHTALLFGFSHSCRFFTSDNAFVSTFVDYSLKCLANESLAKAASLSIFYVVQSQILLLVEEGSDFTSLFVEQAEFYLNQLERSIAVRMFRICTLLIYSTQDDDYQIKQTKILFEPVMEMLQKPNVTQESFMSAFEIIKDCSYCNWKFSSLFFKDLWPILFEVAQLLIPNINASSELLEYLLSAIASCVGQVGREDYETAKSVITTIIELISQRSNVEDYFFEFFSIIAYSIPQSQVDFYNIIRDSFILPILETESPPLKGILTMLSNYDYNLLDIEWVLSLSLFGINNYTTEINEAAIDCMTHILVPLFTKEDYKQIRDSTQLHILETVLTCIADSLHKPSFEKYVELIRSILELIMSDNEINIFDEFVNIVSRVFPEALNTFINQFVEYIFEYVNSCFEFRSAFANFLVVSKRASPSDATIFKINKPKYYDFMMVNLNSIFANAINKEVDFQMKNEDIGKPIRILSISKPMLYKYKIDKPLDGVCKKS